MRRLVRVGRVLLALHVVALAWVLLAWPALGFMLGTRPAPELSEPRVRPQSTIERVGDLWHVHLVGSPAERGFACGLLTAPMMAKHEDELYATLESLVPSFLLRHLILGSVTFNGRGLEDHLLASEREAIGGIALGYREAGDPRARVGPAYARILGYHALHDASQYLIDNPLVNAPLVGCSAVAVADGRSVGGHVLVGRLFDFEGGRSFDTDKVVYTVEPGGAGQRFVHVAWGGVHGAVTGMNEAGLWLSINAGVSDGVALTGTPLVVAIHRALETCRTIDEAIALLTSIEVFVSESVLIASSKDAERPAVVLELSPGEHHVRLMVDGVLAVANHFEHPDWAGDAANAKRIAEGTTTARRARLGELLERTEEHNAESMLEILRDRRGAGDRDLGFGHRASINAWIGAHLVVADVSAGILWVCEPDHGLGRAYAFDVEGTREDIPPLPASADLALYDDVGHDWKARLERARALVAEERADAQPHLRAMIEDNPRHPEPYALLARVTSETTERERLLREALERTPAYASEVRAIEELLGR